MRRQSGLMCVIMAAMVFVVGCKDKADKAEKKIPASIEALDAVTRIAEAALQRPLIAPERARDGENVAKELQALGESVKGVGKIVTNFLPEKQKPYGTATVAVLTLLTGLAGGAAEWFRRRKNAAVATGVIAADDTEGGGRALMAASVKTNMGPTMTAEYERRVSAGLTSPGGQSASPSEESTGS